jgi:hypothetical protein
MPKLDPPSAIEKRSAGQYLRYCPVRMNPLTALPQNNDSHEVCRLTAYSVLTGIWWCAFAHM